jgi:hypothetical protein
MKVKAIIERGKDGFFSVYMDNDDFKFGLNGQGNTVEEAKADFLVAHDEMKSLFLDENKEFPELVFEYEYDVDSLLNYYAGILSKSGLEKITGVNQKQLWHYSSGKRKPSKQTVLKIESGLRKFGEELSLLHLVD